MPTALKIQRLPNRKLELSWEAGAGRKYSVMKSVDWVTWLDFAGPYDGEDALFVLQIPASDSKAFFKLAIFVPEGYSVPAYTVTALSGQYVILNWENLGPATYPGAHYDVVRDGQLLAMNAHDKSSYRDEAVASGKTYVYDVRFYSA